MKLTWHVIEELYVCIQRAYTDMRLYCLTHYYKLSSFFLTQMKWQQKDSF